MRVGLLFGLTLALGSLAGCVIYLDHPPERRISGLIVRADTGEPLRQAKIDFLSGREPLSLLPVDTFGIDASTKADNSGHFEVTARLKDKVKVWVSSAECGGQSFDLPAFPPDNRLDGLVLRISEPIPSKAVSGNKNLSAAPSRF